MNEWPDLRPILQGIRWVVVGGVATRAYMPERMTKDLDILISAEDGAAALQQLQAAGYKLLKPLAIPGYVFESPTGVEIDLLLGAQPWLPEALEKIRHDAANLPVLDLPYLILMKLSASRGRDLGDITTMLGWADEEALQNVRAVVAAYSPQDSEDLESLIYIGQQERLGSQDAGC